MMLVCSIKVTLGKCIICQSKNIMHYIMLKTVQTLSSFTRVTTYKQCGTIMKASIFFTNWYSKLTTKWLSLL